jgi:hypothetical protein
MPYEGTDERMDRLETVLTSFVRHTQEGNAELRQNITALEKSLASFKEEVRDDIAGMKEWRIQSQKQWGEIAQKIGKFVEDIVAPNIPHVARENFKLTGAEVFSAPRVRLQHPQDSSRLREFDYIYATTTGWIVVDSKNDPKLKDIDEFREMLAEVREYFPQYAALPLYPIFASLYVPDHVVKFCSRHRIYAMGFGPETMQILNTSEIQS